MTCQHCQTWVLDDDHRCQRCGRKVRTSPSRISPETYPIAATATAYAYDFTAETETPPAAAEAAEPGQQPLFTSMTRDPRVIPFESLTSHTERESIRSRAADLLRPPPVKTAKVEVRHARRRKAEPKDQKQLEFLPQEAISRAEPSPILGDIIVAPRELRVRAAVIDGLLMVAGSLFGLAAYMYEGGQFSLDKRVLPFLALAVLTVPIFYKLLWAIADCDTVGMMSSGLRLVNFDGNPPSQERRYQRLFGSFISLLAGGIGMVWALVDEDSLTWHDHISGTFPTVAFED